MKKNVKLLIRFSTKKQLHTNLMNMAQMAAAKAGAPQELFAANSGMPQQQQQQPGLNLQSL